MRSGAIAGLGLAILLAAAAVLYALYPDLLTLEPSAPPAPQPTAPAAAARPARPAPQARAAPAPPAPSFDVVRVSPDGSAVIAGRAAPGAKVTILDNGMPLGTVTSDANGEWALVPDHPMPPGKGRLTLEARLPTQSAAIASKEAVAVTGPAASPPTRTAAAASRAAAPSSSDHAARPSEGRTYVVKPGNSLWRIAHDLYGAGIRYLGIYSANSDRIRNPNLIYPGQRFKLPKRPKPADTPAPAQG